MFATGIENSVPTINNGRTRVDEMESCGHYERWREDFALVEEMGIGFLRFGPPIHRTWLGVGKYDWEFADLTFADLKRRNIVPIVDLCHFGVPDWIGNFQNPDFAEQFCHYALRLCRALSLGAALYAGERDAHLRHLFGAIWLVERAACQRPGVRHRAEAYRQGQRAGDAGDPAGAAGRDLHPERELGIFPCRQPRRDQAGRADERAALPVARPQLRPARRFRDVRVPARQRHDARGVPFLPRQSAEAALHHGQRLLRHQRAPGVGGRIDLPVGRDLRLQRDHPPVSRPLSSAGDAHRDQPRAGRRRGARRWTGCGSNGPTSCACATTACRSSASPGIR